MLAAALGACGVGPEAVAPEPAASNVLSVPSELLPDGGLDYSLLCTLPNMNSQTMTMIARGVQDHCDHMGINVTLHNSHDDHLAQAVEIDTFVTGGGQAVLCRPVDAAALQPFLQVARQQGAYVVSWGENADADACLTVDYRAAGAVLARDAALWAKGLEGPKPAAVVLVSDASVSGFSAGVAEGYAEAFPEEEVTVQTLTLQAETLAEELLTMERAAGIIMADSDAAALLAREKLAEYWQEEQAEEEEPEEPDWSAYYFGGFGATLEGLAAIEAGALQATVGENGYEAGKQMVDMAVQLLREGATETRSIDPVLVDKANAAEYNY